MTSSLAMAASSLTTDLAAVYFKAGDVGGALEATEVGLRVIPGHEELTRLKSRHAWRPATGPGRWWSVVSTSGTVMGNDEMSIQP